MALDRYQYGESVAVFADFKTGKKATPPNTFIDPAAITLVIRRPDKTVETRTYGVSGVTKLDVGRYTSIIELTQEGTYHGRWTGDNGPTQKGVKVFTFESVREPNF